MTKLLLVEDDTAISGPLLRALGREGYDVQLAEAGRDALEAMQGGIDVVILDLGLPDIDGLDVARQARANGWDFPILILTARSEEVDMVVGLDAGADDYVTKPFRLARPCPGRRSPVTCGASPATTPPRNSTCTSRGCAGNSATPSPSPATFPRSAAWGSASRRSSRCADAPRR